jgi:hypothetical protein
MNNRYPLKLSDHAAHRLGTRIKRHKYVQALVQVGDVDMRGRCSVAARDLCALAGEARAERRYEDANIMDKIHNLTVVISNSNEILTMYRSYGKPKKIRDDGSESRRQRRRLKADRRRRAGW